MEKKNITQLRDCYGCGVCVKACPVKIISLVENKEGFYSPFIEEPDKCIECGMCLKICASNHKEIAGDGKIHASYAGWSVNPNVRYRCSSGGVGFEIGRHLIDKGYSAVGVKYDLDKRRAVHYISDTVESFMLTAGSKYMQSYTADALMAIDPKKKYLVTGTPCQIDSFRRYIRTLKKEDNFVLLDFFCHGVPSLLLWDKYLSQINEICGDKLSFVSWRNKETGWHDSWSMQADGAADSDSENEYNLNCKEPKHLYSSRRTAGDFFYKFFLKDLCLNKCCYKSCKYKMRNSAADIRIGDLWGETYSKDDSGVTGVLAFSDKGEAILAELERKDCCFKKEPFKVVSEGQMPKNAREHETRNWILWQLRGSGTLKEINRNVDMYYLIKFLPKRILNRMRRILGNIK